MAENRINGCIFLIYTKKPQPYAENIRLGSENESMMRVRKFRCGNECWRATSWHWKMDTPCERQGDLYDPGSRLQDSRCRDSSEALSSQPSALTCGCRQDDHWHPDHPSNRCRCCGRCNDGHELKAPTPDGTDKSLRPSWCNSDNRCHGNHGLNDMPPTRLPWSPG